MIKQIDKRRFIAILFIFMLWLTKDNEIIIDAKSLIDQLKITFIDSSVYYERNLSYENFINYPKFEDNKMKSIINDFKRVIDIPDVQLKKKLNKKLGKSEVADITLGELQSLTSLSLNLSNIVSIEGLQYATNLEQLNLSYNKITDISPLGEGDFSKLKHLYLHNNQISDISALGKGNFSKLVTLYLEGNQISDVSALGRGSFKELFGLYLQNNKINDISFLGKVNLDQLEQLKLNNNQISDISALGEGNFTNLRSLNLENNQITNISGFSKGNFDNLEWLYLENNQITNISELGEGEFKTLRTLYLHSNKINDLSVFGEKAFWGLKSLSLNDNQITDISVLSDVNLPNLNYLELARNQIRDISVLSDVNLPNLNYLTLLGNKITDISVLSDINFPNLTTLRLENQIVLLDPIEIEKGQNVKIINPLLDNKGEYIIPNISNNGYYDSKNQLIWDEVYQSQDIHFTFNKIIDFEQGISTFSGTIILPVNVVERKIIDIPDIQLKKQINSQLGKLETDDITLQELRSFTSLNLASSDISNIEGLQYASNLKKLDLSSNQISDITPLGEGNFRSLTYLSLSGNQISDISSLGKDNFGSLIYLNLSYNQISNISPLGEDDFVKLEQLYLTNNVISDISPLCEGNFENLQQLNLSYNQITDLSPLLFVNFPNLIYFYLNEQKILLDEIEIYNGQSVKIANPIIDNKGEYIIPRILNGGRYDYKQNQLIWDNIYESQEVTVSFYENSMSIPGYPLFSGSITIPIKVSSYCGEDINTDGIIDQQDLKLISQWYNITSDSPEWNLDVDLNRDGIIDLFDFILISNKIDKVNEQNIIFEVN